VKVDKKQLKIKMLDSIVCASFGISTAQVTTANHVEKNIDRSEVTTPKGVQAI